MEPKSAEKPKEAPVTDEEALHELRALLASPKKEAPSGLSTLLSGALQGTDSGGTDARRRLLEALQLHKQKTSEDDAGPYDTSEKASHVFRPHATRDDEVARETCQEPGGASTLPTSGPYVSSPSLGGALPGADSERRARSKAMPRTPIKFVGRRPSPAKRNTGLANKLEKARRRAEATEVIQDSEEDDIIPGLGGEEHAGGQTDNVE